MVLFIDNYDSFTYNLVQYVGVITRDITVWRNDQFKLDDITALSPSHIIISPGPGTPADAGLSVDVIKSFYRKIPIYGVCLGHQAIGHAFGGVVSGAPTIMHGKLSQITHNGKDLFQNIPSPFTATRYHSLIIQRDTLPSCLAITAETGGLIMGVRHKDAPLFGVQFHPESIATEHGVAMIGNFLAVKN